MSPKELTFCGTLAVAAFESPWLGDILKNRFSKTSNKAIIEAIHKIDYKVDCNRADRSRQRILRFNGEIRRGFIHDEQEFNDVLEAIYDYEHFCDAHPDYPNSKAKFAITNTKRVYKKCNHNDSFKYKGDQIYALWWQRW